MASDPRSGADHSLDRGSAQPRIHVQESGSLWRRAYARHPFLFTVLAAVAGYFFAEVIK